MTDQRPDDHSVDGDDQMHPVAKALFGWTEYKRTPVILLAVVIGVCIGLASADLMVNRHDYFHFAESTAFYAIWGFAAFALAVLSGWPLGKLLRRDEDYYGEAETTPSDTEANLEEDA